MEAVAVGGAACAGACAVGVAVATAMVTVGGEVCRQAVKNAGHDYRKGKK